MEIRTTKCAKWGHREFCISYDASNVQNDVIAFANYLEESVADGTRFENGQTIELGSMLVRLLGNAKEFAFEEPDLQNIHITWTPGISNSLRAVRIGIRSYRMLAMYPGISRATVRLPRRNFRP